MSEADRIILDRSAVYYTHSPADAFHVLRGRVQVYIVPLRSSGDPGKQLPLMPVDAGHVIPALCCKDMNGRQWRFVFTSATSEGAELAVLHGAATLPLKQRFIQSAGIQTWQDEGYEGSLLEIYQQRLLKDRVFLERATRNAEAADKLSGNLIHQAVAGKISPADVDGSPLFHVLTYACRRGHIGLASRERLAQACRQMTVPAIARASHFVCRRVTLDADWYRHDCGILIGKLDGQPVACLPCSGGYRYYISGAVRELPLTPAQAGRIEPGVYAISRSLPDVPLGRRELCAFMLDGLRPSDAALPLLFGLLAALCSLMLPLLSRLLFDRLIPLGAGDALARLCVPAVTFMLGSVLIGAGVTLMTQRIAFRAGYDLQTAAYHRLFQLPEHFFRKNGSA